MIDAPGRKIFAVGSLLAENARASCRGFVPRNQRAAFSRHHVLGGVETETPELAQGPARATIDLAPKRMRGILNNRHRKTGEILRMAGVMGYDQRARRWTHEALRVVEINIEIRFANLA